MRTLSFDLRDALRSLRRDRLYAATVILILAVTIGATTAVFSIVDGVLLKPLAYRESHRLVALREVWREFVDRTPTLTVNERHFEYWREHARSFESLAQYVARPANLTGADEAAQLAVVRASGSLFEVLGVQATIGRTLLPGDEGRDRADVVVIADALWRQRFGSDPSLVGRTITLDGRPSTVVGVLPPDFRLPAREQLTAAIDAVIPLRVDVGWVGDHNNTAIGRLRPGVTPEEARAELDILQAQVSAIATREAHETVTLSSAVTPLAESVVGLARRGLLLLFGAIAAVLFIACSNLANLSLTRALGRLRESAIRSALGATRRRLVIRAVLEQLLLSAAGGALGVWIAWAALAGFVRTAPVDLPRLNEVALDGRVLAFAAVVSLLTGLLVAALPAWRAGSRDAQAMLRPGGAAVASDRSGMRTRASLLALQVALSVTLLVVTGLLTASFVHLLNVDRGFTAERVLAVGVALPAARYETEPLRLAAYDRLLAASRALPGVRSVTLTSMLPLAGSGQVNFIAAEGAVVPRSEQPSANFRFVAPEFFTTLEITLRRGRPFTDDERDPSRPAPVVVSEPVAARLWPGQDPIGKRFSRGFGAAEQGFAVVGVAADARLTTIDRTPPLMVYVPYWWRSRTSTSLLIKTAADPAAMASSIRRAVADIDPEIAIGHIQPLEQLVVSALSGRRYQAELFVVFGAVALFIALVGVYAVTSYGVSRRRREMNIRAALGAARGQVLGMVVRQSSVPILAGVAAGGLGAVAIGGLVASLLFEVRPRDPVVLSSVAALVATAGVLAAVLAARQGLSIDPAAALRDE